jgi:dephospho-CoA kinase
VVQQAISIALTGGIASGKSATTQRFVQLGVPVFDADRIAHDLVQPGQIALGEIVQIFGPQMLQPDGSLDRARLRALVFTDANERRRLESILHPRVRDVLLAQAQSCTATYCVLAIPLLVECRNDYTWVNRILTTDVPRAVQLTRLTHRPGIDATLAERMLAAQATREQRLELAHDVIDNTGPLEALDATVARLHVIYSALTGARAQK